MTGSRYYKSSDQILTVDHSFKPKYDWESPRSFTYIFDFEFRTMTVITGYNSGAEKAAVHPFPAVDAEVLERMRDKLVELGGSPSPLVNASAKPSFPAAPALRKKDDGGLNL